MYNTTFYSFARSLLSALYCHGYSKFGLGPGGGGGGGEELELYWSGGGGGGGGAIAPLVTLLTTALICIA